MISKNNINSFFVKINFNFQKNLKNSIVTYGGYEINRGIVADFYKMKIINTDNYQWSPVQISNQN